MKKCDLLASRRLMHGLQLLLTFYIISSFQAVYSTEVTINSVKVPADWSYENLSNINLNRKKKSLDCECVPYYLCENNTIITDGVWKGLFIPDIRFRGYECEDIIEECCQRPKLTSHMMDSKPYKSRGCGFRNVDGVGPQSVLGDMNESRFGEFPWIIAVLREESVGGNTVNVYQCGGSLIHSQVVLTTAECVKDNNMETLRIRAGEWNTQYNNEFYPHQDRKVVHALLHNESDGHSIQNDIALLVLNKPVQLKEHIDTICLPLQNEKFDKSKCVLSGWGNSDTSSGNTNFISTPKKLDVSVIPRRQCRQILHKNRYIKSPYLHKNYICGSDIQVKNFFDIDNGSPLVCPISGTSGRYVQAGILAWKVAGKDKRIPGVYWNVARLRNWIERLMLRFNFPAVNINNTL